jgi:hypothetical protein
MRILNHKITYSLTGLVGVAIILVLYLKAFLSWRNHEIHHPDFNIALSFHVFNFGGMCVLVFLTYLKYSLIKVCSYFSLLFGTLFYSGLLYGSALGILKHDQIDVFLQLGIFLLCFGWLLFFLSTYSTENARVTIVSRR